MVLLEKLWDDVVAGPQPERGLGKLRKLTTLKTDEGESSRLQKSLSMPNTPSTPLTPTTPTTPGSGRKADNVWRSVFHPGSNSATKTLGAQMFDKPLPNTPTVYDWYVYTPQTSRTTIINYYLYFPSLLFNLLPVLGFLHHINVACIQIYREMITS
ncbi:hypothetical protein PHAVU_006G183600 [Phaseolus vulgaris]|uniref:Auxin-repressed protein n=1 Tax=Phaseolus vulgaris TaxID=3885 RepID=V7BSY6_PHAVU|nr:hypothetical protein PHAVU_006G183600g [Phaseolus vulgaris]ESW20135.1 hypothetical protein PHAVU_006G183600g [Phaseolus vulgaris]